MSIVRKGVWFVMGILLFVTIFNLSTAIPQWEDLSGYGRTDVVVTEMSDNVKPLQWKGEDVIKLALDASKGNIILVVDGIQIDSNTNLDTINLRGLVGKDYDVEVLSTSGLSYDVVVANIR